MLPASISSLVHAALGWFAILRKASMLEGFEIWPNKDRICIWKVKYYKMATHLPAFGFRVHDVAFLVRQLRVDRLCKASGLEQT